MTCLSKDRLFAALNDLAAEAGTAASWTNTTWTVRIKTLLCNLGSPFSVCASGVKNGRWGEWMCDVVWLNVDDAICLHSVELAAESEWGNDGDIMDDFQKLIAIRATTRLIIFQENKKGTADSLIDKMKHQIAVFRGSSFGDRYLFACYRNEAIPFTVYEYIHGVSSAS